MEHTKRLFLILILFLGCKKEEPPLALDDYEGMFEQVWADFDQTYSYFELKGIDWDSVYAEHRPKIVNGKTSFSESARIIGEMTLALKDLHVRFLAGNTLYQFDNVEKFAANSPANAQHYLSAILFETNALLFAELKGVNVAYLRVKNLGSTANVQALESVYSSLPTKDGLILDLRDNGGGNDAIARGFVNKITKAERVHELVRFREGAGRHDFGDWIELHVRPENPIDFDKPIAVLINRGVASSAESFVTMMQSLPNTVLIGDTTRGSTGNPKEYTLPNSWKYYVSSWQVVTPNFEFIEDQGIAPDSVVHNTAASMAEGRDLILEKALEFLQ